MIDLIDDNAPDNRITENNANALTGNNFSGNNLIQETIYKERGTLKRFTMNDYPSPRLHTCKGAQWNKHYYRDLGGGHGHHEVTVRYATLAPATTEVSRKYGISVSCLSFLFHMSDDAILSTQRQHRH